MKLKIIGSLLAVGLVASYSATHTKSHVTSAYEDYIIGQCKSDPMCLIGAAVVEKQVVLCSQNKLLSTSTKTFHTCIEKVADEINKQN